MVTGHHLRPSLRDIPSSPSGTNQSHSGSPPWLLLITSNHSWNSPLKLFFLIIYVIVEYCIHGVLRDQKRLLYTLNGITGICEPPNMSAGKLNLGQLQEQSTALNHWAVLLHPHIRTFKFWKWTLWEVIGVRSSKWSPGMGGAAYWAKKLEQDPDTPPT